MKTNFNDDVPSLSIFQAILWVIAFGVLYAIFSMLFGLITSPDLSGLLGYLSVFFLLIACMPRLIKNGWVDRSWLRLDPKLSSIIILLGVLSALSVEALPTISWINDTEMIEMIKKQMEIKEANLYSFLTACVMAPVLEELLFRGIILGGLLRRYSPAVAVGVSALLFGIMHFNITTVVLAGLIWGWIYYKTGNLLYTIVIHFIMNLKANVMWWLIQKYDPNIFNNFTDDGKYAWMTSGWYYTAAVAVLVSCTIGLYFIFKRKNRQPVAESEFVEPA